jgi:hypothetical protein
MFIVINSFFNLLLQLLSPVISFKYPQKIQAADQYSKTPVCIVIFQSFPVFE